MDEVYIPHWILHAWVKQKEEADSSKSYKGTFKDTYLIYIKKK